MVCMYVCMYVCMISTKLKVYVTVIIPSLLYGAETWTVLRKHEKQLSAFHMRCLRRILGVNWQDKVSNSEVRKRAGISGIPVLLRLARLRWLGHVVRLGNHRLPKQLLFGRLSVPRPSGKPRRRWSDCVMSDLSDAKIGDEWYDLAMNKTTWTNCIKDALHEWETVEDERRALLREARRQVQSLPSSVHFECLEPGCTRQFTTNKGLLLHARQVHRVAHAVVPVTDIPDASTTMRASTGFECPQCDKVCKNKSGLTRHLKTHGTPYSRSMTGNPSLECPRCSKTCTSKSGLTRHMNSCSHPSTSTQGSFFSRLNSDTALTRHAVGGRLPP